MAEQSDLVCKTGTKNVVWDYFGLQKDKDGHVVDNGEVVCRSCRKKVIAKNGNTSNLLAHMQNHHGELHAEVQQAMKAKKDLPRQSAQHSGTSNSSRQVQALLKETIEKTQKYKRKRKK